MTKSELSKLKQRLSEQFHKFKKAKDNRVRDEAMNTVIAIIKEEKEKSNEK